jgi:hypothetical protein
VLAVMERVLGPEHRRTLDARNNLAHWLGQSRKLGVDGV